MAVVVELAALLAGSVAIMSVAGSVAMSVAGSVAMSVAGSVAMPVDDSITMTVAAWFGSRRSRFIQQFVLKRKLMCMHYRTL